MIALIPAARRDLSRRFSFNHFLLPGHNDLIRLPVASKENSACVGAIIDVLEVGVQAKRESLVHHLSIFFRHVRSDKQYELSSGSTCAFL